MLTKLTVENYQCHAAKEVDLGQITVLTGPSDRGKSALLRALIWAVTNKPSGDGDTSWGAADRAASVVVDGHTVGRSKGKGGNTYSLDDDDYAAFGAGVPDEVTQLVGFDVDGANVQGQHDGAFWLTRTPGQLSQDLNRIVDLSMIDNAIAAANRDLQNKQTAYRVKSAVYEEAVSALTRLDFVPTMDAEAVVIEQLDKRHSDAATAAEQLADLCQTLRNDAAVIKHNAGIGDAWADVVGASEAYHKARAAANNLADDIHAAKTATADVRRCAAAMDATNKELSEIEVCPTCQRPM